MYSDVDVPYYAPQEKRTAQLNARVPAETKVSVEALARFWTHVERERSGDPEAEVTVTDVVNRLLTIGLTGAWGEAGLQGPPEDEESWKKVTSGVARALAGKPAK
jgi:hypothetical protein